MKTKEDASDALREGEAISDVVDVEESKSHEPKTNVVQTKMQMQSVCDEGIERFESCIQNGDKAFVLS